MSHESTKPPVDASGPHAVAPVARFQAKHLIALEPLIRAGQARTMISGTGTSGLIVEPDPEGGVILVATNGSALVAIRDRAGRANRPMRITVDDATFTIARPPAPVSMWAEGETYTVPLPEWAQPGVMFATDLSCFVFPLMHLPGEAPASSPVLGHAWAEDGPVPNGGYRIHKTPPTLNWRDLFARAPLHNDGRSLLLPETVALFTGIQDLYDTVLQFDASAPGAPIIVSAPGRRDVIGALMPARGDLVPDPVPLWACV